MHVIWEGARKKKKDCQPEHGKYLQQPPLHAGMAYNCMCRLRIRAACEEAGSDLSAPGNLDLGLVSFQSLHQTKTQTGGWLVGELLLWPIASLASHAHDGRLWVNQRPRQHAFNATRMAAPTNGQPTKPNLQCCCSWTLSSLDSAVVFPSSSCHGSRRLSLLHCPKYYSPS